MMFEANFLLWISGLFDTAREPDGSNLSSEKLIPKARL